MSVYDTPSEENSEPQYSIFHLYLKVSHINFMCFGDRGNLAFVGENCLRHVFDFDWWVK